MRVRIAFLAFSLACASAYGQNTAPLQLAVVPGPAPSQSPVTAVTNTGSKTVTAFAISSWARTTGAPAKSPGLSIFDAARNPSLSPILPGQREVILPGLLPQDPAMPGPEVVAVIFADGASWGDATWVQRLAAERVYMLKELTASLQDLQQAQQAQKQGAGRAALTARLQLAMETALASATDGVDRMCVSKARQEALLNMRSAFGYDNHLDRLLKNQVERLILEITKLRSYGDVQ